MFLCTNVRQAGSRLVHGAHSETDSSGCGLSGGVGGGRPSADQVFALCPSLPSASIRSSLPQRACRPRVMPAALSHGPSHRRGPLSRFFHLDVEKEGARNTESLLCVPRSRPALPLTCGSSDTSARAPRAGAPGTRRLAPPRLCRAPGPGHDGGGDASAPRPSRQRGPRDSDPAAPTRSCPPLPSCRRDAWAPVARHLQA